MHQLPKNDRRKDVIQDPTFDRAVSRNVHQNCCWHVGDRARKSEREKERKTERQKDRKRKKEERIGVSVRDRLGLCFGIDAAFALGSNRPPTLWEKSYVNLPCREKRFSMFDFPKNIIPFPEIIENPRCIYISFQTYAPS